MFSHKNKIYLYGGNSGIIQTDLFSIDETKYPLCWNRVKVSHVQEPEETSGSTVNDWKGKLVFFGGAKDFA
jgi:hypothetical protein